MEHPYQKGISAEPEKYYVNETQVLKITERESH